MSKNNKKFSATEVEEIIKATEYKCKKEISEIHKNYIASKIGELDVKDASKLYVFKVEFGEDVDYESARDFCKQFLDNFADVSDAGIAFIPITPHLPAKDMKILTASTANASCATCIVKAFQDGMKLVE